MKAQNFFTDTSAPGTPFSDEAATETASSAAYDTLSVDAFRHGVEIRTEKQYANGAVKILSGERGHALAPLSPAQDSLTARPRDVPFADTAAEDLSESRCSFSVSSDDDSSGVIDVLSVRPETSLTLQLANDAATSGVRGACADDESDSRSAGVITSVDEWISRDAAAAFHDVTDSDLGRNVDLGRAGSYFDVDSVSCDIFARESWPSQAPQSVDAPVVELLIAMAHNSDSYVKSWQRSATCGFTYAGSAGTDSVAFGDMTRK